QRRRHRGEPRPRRVLAAGPGLRRTQVPRPVGGRAQLAARLGRLPGRHCGDPARRVRSRADHTASGQAGRRPHGIPPGAVPRRGRSALVPPRDPHRPGARRPRAGAPFRDARLTARRGARHRCDGAAGADPAAPARGAPRPGAGALRPAGSARPRPRDHRDRMSPAQPPTPPEPAPAPLPSPDAPTPESPAPPDEHPHAVPSGRRSGLGAVLQEEEFSAADAIGGPRGIVESVLPTLLFVVLFVLTRSVMIAGITATAVVLVLLVARILQRESP